MDFLGNYGRSVNGPRLGNAGRPTQTQGGFGALSEQELASLDNARFTQNQSPSGFGALSGQELASLANAGQPPQDQLQDNQTLDDKYKKAVELLIAQQEYAQQQANTQPGGQRGLLPTIDPRYDIGSGQFSANVPRTPLRVSGSPSRNQNIRVDGRIPF